MLINWSKKQKDSLALAFFFHHKMENIHPFADGNGRTGRIVMNHILITNNYPPIVIPQTLRKEYLQVLSASDKAVEKDLLSVNMKHYRKFFSFMLDKYLATSRTCLFAI